MQSIWKFLFELIPFSIFRRTCQIDSCWPNNIFVQNKRVCYLFVFCLYWFSIYIIAIQCRCRCCYRLQTEFGRILKHHRIHRAQHTTNYLSQNILFNVHFRLIIYYLFAYRTIPVQNSIFLHLLFGLGSVQNTEKSLNIYHITWERKQIIRELRVGNSNNNNNHHKKTTPNTLNFEPSIMNDWRQKKTDNSIRVEKITSNKTTQPYFMCCSTFFCISNIYVRAHAMGIFNHRKIVRDEDITRTPWFLLLDMNIVNINMNLFDIMDAN